ncbi:MAG: glycosyltransferase [Eubacteriales bacterium]|nr:glycosyltransferase [Eubacteriales bacterium]
MIKVSVIVPVYNVEKYLRQCMDSIVQQTLREIEIICVNDSSTDQSLSILEEYARSDERVKVITQKNAGAGAARNTGMSVAQGKYLSFLDSDDFFEKDMLEKAYNLAEQDQTDFVVYKSDQYHTEDDKFVPVSWVVREKEIPPYQPFNHRQMTDNIFKVFVGWAWDKLYRRDFVEKHQLKFQEQRTSNDMLFVFSAVVLARRISVLPQVLAHQRRDAKDSLSKTRENSWWCFYDALMALRERLIGEELYEEVEKDYINYALHFALWNYDTLAEPTKTKLLEKLKGEWFSQLGITGKDRDYFYNKKEYDKYTCIVQK